MIIARIVTKYEESAGLPLKIDCASCTAKATPAVAVDTTAREYLYGLIPVTTSHYTSITCGSCGRAFRVPLSCDQLAAMTPAQITQLVATEGMAFVGNITKFCIVMSLVFCLLPFFGLCCAIAGVIGTRKCRSNWRTAARVGFAISLVLSLVATVVIATQKSP
jgi:hypothetical protein